jgi:hypothetical protein
MKNKQRNERNVVISTSLSKMLNDLFIITMMIVIVRDVKKIDVITSEFRDNTFSEKVDNK